MTVPSWNDVTGFLPTGSLIAAFGSILAIVLAVVDLIRLRASKERSARIRDILAVGLSVIILAGTAWGAHANRERLDALSAEVGAKQDRHVSNEQGAMLKGDLVGLSGEAIALRTCNATRESSQFATELADALRGAGLRVLFSPGMTEMCFGGVGPPLSVTVAAPHTATQPTGNLKEVGYALVMRQAFIDAKLLAAGEKVGLDSPPRIGTSAVAPPSITITVWPM